MDRVAERLDVAAAALATLRQVLDLGPGDAIRRDASIQRFEYTFEACWKAAKDYLWRAEGLEAASPKGVWRACWQVGLLDEAQARLALAMTDDRNLTSHTYNEALAEAIHGRLGAYVALLGALLGRLRERPRPEAS